MNLKSFVLCGIMLPCAMAILACSDSETSNPIANGPTGAFVGVKYHMTLDEANQNFLLNRTYNQDVCIRQNEQYEFTTIVGSSYAERDYAFIGDTLVTFNKKYQEDYGEVFVGGTNGQIRNKWRLMNECRFIPENNSIKCATAEELGSKALHTITYYEFTQDTLYSSVMDLNGKVLDPESQNKDEYDDFTDSYYMQNNMYVVVAVHEGTVLDGFNHPEELFFGSDVDDYAQRNGIVINSRTKNYISFTYKSQTFEMEFTKALKLFNGNGSHVEIDATFKSDNGTCRLNYMSEDKVTSDVCKAENASWLEFYPEPSNGNLSYDKATRYHIGNATEFKKCIESLVKK